VFKQTKIRKRIKKLVSIKDEPRKNSNEKEIELENVETIGLLFSLIGG
jgi:hypothetical protein